MVASGTAALLYEVVLQKLFTFVLGGSLIAATVTISAYMAGLSLGAYLLGRLSSRLASERAALRLYAGLELGVGFAAVGCVVAYALTRTDSSEIWTKMSTLPLLIRAVVAFLVLLPVTTLLGGTFPVIGKASFAIGGETRRDEAPPPSARTLYAANLLGAVLGTGFGAYVVIPTLGLWGAAAVGFAMNLVVAIAAWRRRSRSTVSAKTTYSDATDEGFAGATKLARKNLFLAFVSGALLFGLEIIWTHLLAAIVGSSVYAFAHMLLSVLLALCLAAYRDRDTRSLPDLLWMGAHRLAFSIPLFALTSLIFAAVGLFEPGFPIREITRLAIASLLIVPTAIVLSQIFPRLLDEVSRERNSHVVGTIVAVNTVGCLTGLLLGRFILVPRLGSSASLRGIVSILVVSSLWLDRDWLNALRKRLASSRRRWLTIGAVLAFLVPSWRPAWLLSGRNIYFSLTGDGDFHDLLYLAEDAESGFVTVHRNSKGVLELRTNGKFEGNDADEMGPQLAFGYLPALMSERTENAFLIGLGTGVSLKGLGDFDFKHIDLAERATPMIHAAKTYFSGVNGNILSDPRIAVIHDDGRNALRASTRKYDVVSIEITSIWFAGAADLYSRDFYRLVRSRLAAGGVFQQWMQLHHMRRDDLWVALNTARSEFAHVALWYSGGQGQIIASNQPISVDWKRLRAPQRGSSGVAMDQETLLRSVGSLLLDENGVNEYLAAAAKVLGAELSSRLTSSDLWPYLEYATPKGNALQLTDRMNVFFLRELIGRATPVPLRNADVTDPLFPAVRAYFDQRCESAADLASRLPPETRKAFSVLSSCRPWLPMPSTKR